jgi:ABC-type hemin transport system substrate-binding protein
MDMMMQSLIKSIGVDPAKIMEIAGQFQTTLQAFKEQMDRIEKQNVVLFRLVHEHLEPEAYRKEPESDEMVANLNGAGHA